MVKPNNFTERLYIILVKDKKFPENTTQKEILELTVQT